MICGVRGARFEIDGRPVASEGGAVEVPLEQGVHRVRVTAPGFKPFDATPQVDEGKAVEVQANLDAVPVRRAPGFSRPQPTPKRPPRPTGDYTLDPY